MKKQNQKRLLCLVLFAAMVLALTACAGSAPTNGGNSTEGAPALSAVTKDPYTDEIKIAYLPNTLASGNGAVWGDAAGDELADYKNVTYNIFDGKGSAETQNEIISELIVQGYDALILQPADASALAASVTRAEQAGMKVITLNIGVDTPHTCHLQAANFESGVMAARALGEAMTGEGTVGLIDIASNMRAVVLIGEGFKETMAAEYPNITVIAEQEGDWTAETANSITRDYLSKYPEMEGIYTCGDPAALGAMQAAQAAGREDLMIVGTDGEATCMSYIESGAITGTVYMDFYDMGRTAARIALYAIDSGIDGSTYSATPLIKIPAFYVDQSNVDTIAQDKRW